MTGRQTVTSDPAADNALQSHLLEGVSRTFALTIPQLPPRLYAAVANAYLLCRIVDTIEDEATLDSAQKRAFCREFIDVVRGRADSAAFSARLAPLLSERTLPAEHELIREVPRVIAITHGLADPQVQALADCVAIMGKGMAEFQDQDLSGGLKDMAEMDRYCYFVAGCVGEMLTRLFCHYLPELAPRREEMLRLAVSFGQGLQMTNILKDIWDDASRGVCWLPQAAFDASFELRGLPTGHDRAEFREGLLELVGIAHGHLRNALEYTLMIPAHETGIREFCLWALGMAVLTLRKIAAHPDFSASAQVKISRRSVKATILASRLARRHDFLLKLLFNLASLGLPHTRQPVEPPTIASPDRTPAA
ncbi:MAG TPA: phytoene/squalene synthase family protein [Methylococcaceae bacterium]|nr:phytoene/squalene synthase family protein [Methylococcaceae bacterium]